MVTEQSIVPMFYSRDALSSGLVRDRTAKIMQGNEVFCDILHQQKDHVVHMRNNEETIRHRRATLAHVMLSAYATGITSDIEHCVTNGEHSWFFAFIDPDN